MTGRRLLAWILPAALAWALPAGARAALGAAPEPPAAEIGEAISVNLLSFRARIVDPSGAPLAGLKPEDFHVRAGDTAVPVLAVDFIDRAVAPDDPADPGLPTDAEADPKVLQASSQGQLFVVFVEAAPRKTGDKGPRFDPTAGRGRIPSAFQKLLAALRPDARLAVVAFGHHLVPAVDFGLDRKAAWEAIVRAIDGDEPAPAVRATGSLSLVAEIDPAEARAATTPERALALTARALAPLPGEKVLFHLGMGGGSFRFSRPDPTPELEEALAAVAEARATVFAVARLGVISPGSRLALGRLTGSTGGAWATNEKEIERLARTVAGYFVISLDAEVLKAVPDGTPLDVELAGRRGTILMAPLATLKAYL